ncbi:hypothetical protein B1748_17945 [Paenibacillus sp. MY03]|nr:hypothetical protein B1748_17945 [Paenibacillus sp. MY03]
MESAFSDSTGMFSAGAGIIVKMLFLYIILPEIVVIIVIGGILRIRGKLFGFLCTGEAYWDSIYLRRMVFHK